MSWDDIKLQTCTLAFSLIATILQNTLNNQCRSLQLNRWHCQGNLSTSYQTALKYHKLAHWRNYLWKVEWLKSSDLKKLFFSQTEGSLELTCELVWICSMCFAFVLHMKSKKVNEINQATMGPWDHYSCNELFSDLSEAHIHAVLHLKERDCLYSFGENTKCLLSVRCYTLFQQKALKHLKMPRRVLTLSKINGQQYHQFPLQNIVVLKPAQAKLKAHTVCSFSYFSLPFPRAFLSEHFSVLRIIILVPCLTPLAHYNSKLSNSDCLLFLRKH